MYTILHDFENIFDYLNYISVKFSNFPESLNQYEVQYDSMFLL